ncbi:MAG: plasmid mobilization relaxosome protein MobC [Solirubrobacterales bacterium]|nr:plasmid mobilization relaxosome protein MobC [Solirubrobacterales bacterium]
MSDESPSGRQLKRRRRANVEGGRQRSHRVLVTAEEESRLVLLAGEQCVTVPRLLIETTLAGAGETPTVRRDAMSELFALRRLLAGASTNINQLARVGNTEGNVPVGSAASVAEIRALVGRIDAAIEGLRSP